MVAPYVIPAQLPKEFTHLASNPGEKQTLVETDSGPYTEWFNKYLLCAHARG